MNELKSNYGPWYEITPFTRQEMDRLAQTGDEEHLAHTAAAQEMKELLRKSACVSPFEIDGVVLEYPVDGVEEDIKAPSLRKAYMLVEEKDGQIVVRPINFGFGLVNWEPVGKTKDELLEARARQNVVMVAR